MRRLSMQAEDALSVLTAHRLYLLLKRMAFLRLRYHQCVALASIALQAEERLQLIAFDGSGVLTRQPIPKTSKALPQPFSPLALLRRLPFFLSGIEPFAFLPVLIAHGLTLLLQGLKTLGGNLLGLANELRELRRDFSAYGGLGLCIKRAP